jgi:hypothetical protein
MKSLIRAQHRSLASSLYKDLARDLNLPPEQAEALYDAVAERLGTLSEAGLEAITDGTFDTTRAAASTRTAQEASDARLRELLGETGLQRFKSYEKTTGERVVLNQLANQLNGTSNQLADHQRQGLLEIMIAERAQAPPLPNSPGNPVDFSEKAMSQVLAAQQSFQQRVHARALGILNPGQLQALDAFFEQQIAAQKVGMEMMRGSQ